MVLTLAVTIGFQDTTFIGNAYGKSLLSLCHAMSFFSSII
jgi:KUP system potassium uptake protein